MAFFLLRWTSTPLIRALTSEALIISVKIFSVVVFPAPLGPRKPTHFEPSIFKLRLDNAVKEPYRFVRFSATMDGALIGSHRVERFQLSGYSYRLFAFDNQLTTILNTYCVAPRVSTLMYAILTE